MTTHEMLLAAKGAESGIALLDTERKNEMLYRMADALEAGTEEILKENAADTEDARAHLSPVMLDRLTLSRERIRAMAEGIRAVAVLPDPVGCVQEEFDRPNGLCIRRVSVPIGVVAMIYESRPNVTSDAAALCLKSGNVAVLRPGKEAYRTSRAIVTLFRDVIESCGGDKHWLNIPEDSSREAANELMSAVGLVDLLIPRGGAGLIRSCVENAKVPCIQTGTGICHIYVDATADLDDAVKIIENAKASRPSVCNAEEVCLVHRDVAKLFLPMLKKRLADDRTARGLTPVELRTDPEAYAVIGGVPAGDGDFDTEFLDYILAVHVVGSVDEAIAHIARHSTHHSDAILTQTPGNAEKFTRAVDSAAVYVNASTRFTDGGEFGLGCEIGISTQKMHARGPMGLRALTSYKYIVTGNGQIR